MEDCMRILSIGDIIGRPGREAVKLVLPAVKHTHNIDFVIAVMLGARRKKRYRRGWDDNTDHKGIQWKIWTGFIWLSIGTSDGPLRTRY
jgi:calcineurin-like phosphoesterase